MSERCYTVAQVCDTLKMSVRTFHRLKRAGRLPFLEELLPRAGRRALYRADLFDRYLAGQWGQGHFGRKHLALAHS